MISKHKLYKIAFVSIAIVLIGVSTTSAMRFGDVILKTNPTTQSVDFLQFPVSGWEDLNCGYESHTPYQPCDKSCDKSCDKCPNCPAPTLKADITRDKDSKGQTIYNYKVTNTGNAPLTGVASFDNKIYPGSLTPGENIQFQTLKPILH